MAAGVAACFGWTVLDGGRHIGGCGYSGVNFGSRKKQSFPLLSHILCSKCLIVCSKCIIVHDLLFHSTKAMHLNLNHYAPLQLLSRISKTLH